MTRLRLPAEGQAWLFLCEHVATSGLKAGGITLGSCCDVCEDWAVKCVCRQAAADEGDTGPCAGAAGQHGGEAGAAGPRGQAAVLHPAGKQAACCCLSVVSSPCSCWLAVEV